MSKNILIFSDGTGQAGGIRPDQRLSNVYKLYRATRVSSENKINPSEQIAYYDAGLGTEEDSKGLLGIKKKISKILASISGRGITNNITQCYEAILNYYEPGDRIFLFGFSRGAYTVRCVANVLALCGIPFVNAEQKCIKKFSSETHQIADEAVRKVYEHGAGRDNQQYHEERKEKAKRFRENYKSAANSPGGFTPHFIGAFDTVAALGATGPMKLLFGSLVMIVGLLLAFGISELLKLFAFFEQQNTFIPILIIFTLVFIAKRMKSSFKCISDFPNPGNFSYHFAEWSMKNYDRHLDSRVRFTRHALAIDETRKNFPRVQWGNKKIDYQSMSPDDPEPFIQLWFAGNHSDIGGSYNENESRLSDIALDWMIKEAERIPNPILIDYRNLNIFPDAGGMQHSEVERVRDRYPSWVPESLRFTWSEKHRRGAIGAPHHSSVLERFKLNTVLKHGKPVPYRPETLKEDSAYKSFYEV